MGFRSKIFFKPTTAATLISSYVYTFQFQALHPALPAILNSNPFSDVTGSSSSIDDVIGMLEMLAEVTHATLLHEEITRQLFTYLFFFTSTNVFNKLVMEGVCICTNK